MIQATNVSHPLNRTIEMMVRAKKRIAPNFALEKLPLFVETKRWVFGRLRQKEVTVHGFPFLLDPLDSLELSIFRNYEPFETSLLTREIRPGSTIVDIGANIGYYTLLFSKLSGEHGRVYAFEPEPQNFGILAQNLSRNQRTNVVAVNKGASDEGGESFLYLSTENHGDHQAYASDENRSKVRIELIKVDDVVSAPVDLVKIDVQGFEYHALRGMQRTIAASPSITIFTEFWPQGLRRAGSDPAEFLNFLRGFGFEIFYINEYANRVEPADDEVLLTRYSVELGSHTNLLCRRRSAHA